MTNLWASIEGTRQRLSGGDGSDNTQFEHTSDGATVGASFERGAEDEGVPDSRVRMPNTFVLSLGGLEPGDDLDRRQRRRLRDR